MSTGQHYGRVAPILALIGSLLLLAGILWGVAAGQGLTRVVPESAGVIRVDGDTVVSVTEGEIRVIYAPAGVVPTCDVYGPTDAVPNLALEGSYTFPLNDVTYESIGKVGGPGELAGDYVIVCGEGDDVVVASPLDVRNDVGAVRAFIGAIILGGTGAVLLVTGGVMWLIGRNGSRRPSSPAEEA